jgi:hypothetical protein
MRHLKLIAAAIIALAAITTTTATATYANQAEGLLPEKTNFIGTGKGGKVITLSGKELKCEATNILSGTMATDSHGTIDIHFEKCKAFGIFAANSLGDTSGTVLAVMLWLLCLIEPKTLVFGIWLEPATPVHMEAGGILTTLQGGLIAKITANPLSLKKTITFEQKGGDTGIASCIGTGLETKKATFTLTEDKGKAESAAYQGSATIEAADKKTELVLMDGN